MKKLLSFFSAAVALSIAPSDALAMVYAIEPFTSVLKRTSAVVEIRITDRQYAYDAELGPATIYTADVAFVHAGTAPPEKELHLRFAGGPTPDGGYMDIAGAPAFSVGLTYVLFLPNENEKWSGMPIAATWSYFELVQTNEGGAVAWSPSEMGWLTGADAAGYPMFAHDAEKGTRGVPSMSLPSATDLLAKIVQDAQSKDSTTASGAFVNVPSHPPFRGTTEKAEATK